MAKEICKHSESSWSTSRQLLEDQSMSSKGPVEVCGLHVEKQCVMELLCFETTFHREALSLFCGQSCS